jgi:hypothetical protein
MKCLSGECHEFLLLLQMLSVKRKRQDHSAVAPLQEVSGKKPNSTRRNNPTIGVRKQGQCKILVNCRPFLDLQSCYILSYNFISAVQSWGGQMYNTHTHTHSMCVCLLLTHLRIA